MTHDRRSAVASLESQSLFPVPTSESTFPGHMSRFLRSLLVAAVLSAAACRPAAVPTARTSPAADEAAYAAFYDPSRALGQLFADVQLAALYPDSKTFADARPRSEPSAIVARYRAERGGAGFDLRRFVEQNFEIPGAVGA